MTRPPPKALADEQRPPTASRDADELAAFARLYGYLRFFHPSDAAAEADWDALAIAGAREIVKVTDDLALADALQRFADPIAPTVQVYREGDPPPSVALAGEGPLVAWQHLGFGFGSMRSAYDSLRSGRSVERPVPGPPWAPLRASLDDKSLRGKTLRLQARVRVEGEAEGTLWLRVDRGEGEMGFFDNMADRPIRSSEWTPAVIEGPVAKDATKVLFGGIASGVGSVCFDDFTIAVIEGDKAKPISLTNPDFSSGTTEGWSTNGEGWVYEIAEDQGNPAVCVRRQMERLESSLFEPLPEPGEVLDLPLAAGLRVRLPVALPDSLARQPPIAEQPHEPGQAADGGDPAVRAAAVIVGWNVLRHFYPYFDVIDEDWDAVLDQTIADLLDDTGPEDLQRTLERMVAKLHDGHGRVYGPTILAYAPVELARVEDKVIVVAAGESSGLAPGDELLATDEVPIAEALAEAASRTSGSPQWIEVYLLRWAGVTAGSREQPARLSLRRSDRAFAVELERELRPPSFPPTRPAIEVHHDGVIYVDLSRASWPEIEARLAELARAPGVVFDLRGYPNSNHQILAHLLREPDTAEWMFVPQILYPAQERIAGWTAHSWSMLPAEPHIAGKVVFLTDARAISYAESVMGLVEGYRLGEIVGAPTAGANGNVNPFTVPGGLQIVFTGMKVTRLDGRQHHGIGVEPTIPAAPTIGGIAAGRDEVLEVGLAVVRSAD